MDEQLESQRSLVVRPLKRTYFLFVMLDYFIYFSLTSNTPGFSFIDVPFFRSLKTESAISVWGEVCGEGREVWGLGEGGKEVFKEEGMDSSD